MTGTLTRLWPYTNMAATGQAMSVRCIDEWRFRDGLLAHNVTIYDCLNTARQLGIVPPQGTVLAKIMSQAAAPARPQAAGAGGLPGLWLPEAQPLKRATAVT